MTRKHLIKAAKLEIELWHTLPPGLAMIILFCFIHRITEGESFEETFFKPQPAVPPPEYENPS